MLIAHLAPMAVVFDAGTCEALLPATVAAVAQRLGATPNRLSGASPKDAVEALYAMQHTLAPDRTIILIIDDLGHRVQEDKTARHVLGPFLGHVGRRLRGRVRVIAVADDALGDGGASPLSEFVEYFPSELRLEITGEIVREIARRLLLVKAPVPSARFDCSLPNTSATLPCTRSGATCFLRRRSSTFRSGAEGARRSRPHRTGRPARSRGAPHPSHSSLLAGRRAASPTAS